MRTAQIIIGLGFGDEGKGATTDYLCSRWEAPLVVRFNGGQQAGHTVVLADGNRHVFSNFGAGTFQGAPTYWSEWCTLAPANVLKEYEALLKLGATPRLFIDQQCAVTTHYDVLYNRMLEDQRGAGRHGSCGMGFGVTVERHTTSPARLCAGDLCDAVICREKLQAVRAYYAEKSRLAGLPFGDFDHDSGDDYFLNKILAFNTLDTEGVVSVVTSEAVFSQDAPWLTYIFEGAQGVLLDMDHGFFPHVTRSNTTSRNAFDLIDRYAPDLRRETQLWYITRAYQTRHGAGPMPYETSELQLKNHEQETNVFNDYQEQFRKGWLSWEQLRYALDCDATYSSSHPRNLMVTCLDQAPTGKVSVMREGVLQEMDAKNLASSLGIFSAVWERWGGYNGGYVLCGF